MAELSDDFLEVLKQVRGEFENTKGGKIGNKVLAHIFSTVFPIFFFGYLIFWEGVQWLLVGEQWLFFGFGILTFALGLVLHKIINSRYVFDDKGVQEISGNGKLKQSIRWADLVRVDYRESRGIKNFTFKTSTAAMNVEYYKSLSEAVAELEKS